MAARSRMSAVKGAALSLLADAYQRRDKVGLVSFRGESAKVLLPPTASVELAAARLEELPTGGRTPLAVGLDKAAEGLRASGISSVVVDTEEGHVRLGMAAGLAELLNARCLHLEDLRADSLVRMVERRRVA